MSEHFFYERQGFYVTSDKKFEEGTTEYFVRLERRRKLCVM